MTENETPRMTRREKFGKNKSKRERMESAPIQEPVFREAEYVEYDEQPAKKKHKRRKKKKRGCLFFILVPLILLLMAGGAFAYLVFNDAQRTITDSLHMDRSADQVNLRGKQVDVKKGKEPFTVLLLGIDTGELGRVEQGRSDTIVIATVNPNTNRTTLTSIPRDTYTEIAGHGTTEKINAAYAYGGTSMAVNTIQELIDVPIDYTVCVNMQGFEQIVDAVGGITVIPPESFTQDQYSFVAGQETRMDGPMALAYSRNRYDTGGDYGRQERQRELIKAILKSASDIESLVSYKGVLESLEGNVTTDMSFDEIVAMAQNYRSALNNLETYQLQGTTANNEAGSVELIDESSLNMIKSQLKNELELN
ncbi:LCP family protein [Vaginisenegalia massiliensis]|uniref:LCP family glycopolymer transferase n=1 Tax=Vaginisenegalia massiliensis TaxID=2058294 RepID=UPI000F538F37|nr:LCP family protein [Vaginisenegalia massiliensis]